MDRLDFLASKMMKPDMGDKCKNFIINYIKENNVGYILEFGSGGSTLMFSDLGCSVLTIEHDIGFFMAGKQLWENNTRIYSFLAMDRGAYIHLAASGIHFDLVFVDGKWRELIMSALQLYGNWKTVMVHDSEREEYQPHFEALKEIGKDISPEGVNLFVCQRR